VGKSSGKIIKLMVCSHMFLCFSYDFAIQASFKRWISPASHGDDLPEGSSLNPEAIPENQQAQAEVASWDKDSIGLSSKTATVAAKKWDVHHVFQNVRLDLRGQKKHRMSSQSKDFTTRIRS